MPKTFAVAAVAAFALGCSSFALTHGALADSITFSTGNVAIGYSDGYWDRGHAWHAWHNDHDRDAYRHSRNAEYHEWKHDRDRDMGWHERHF
jgi:hypothetical protein